MTSSLRVNAKGTALILLDFQDSVIFGVPNAGIPGLPHAEALLSRVADLRAACRIRSILTIHVRVAFRPGHPEISLHNQQFAPVKAGQAMLDGSPETKLAIEPVEGDVLVTKLRVGPFRGTDLDLMLRSAGIDTLIVAGLHTSGTVLSTVREAADLDYRQVVLSDACADADP